MRKTSFSSGFKALGVISLWCLIFALFFVFRCNNNSFVRDRISPNSLSDIEKVIKEYYVDNIDSIDFDEAAINGILKSLDPHSYYLPPSEAQASNDDLMGSFDGIGIQFRMIDDTVTVIQPVQGGPSQRLGIISGDKLISANDSMISGVKMSSYDVMKHLKGPKSTIVKVSVLRAGIKNVLTFNITREPIPSYSIDVQFIIQDSIGYIKLSKFSVTTSEEITNALSTLLEQGMKRLILDLRGNGGGFLSQAVEVADQFLPYTKEIVSIKGKKQETSYSATKEGLFEDKPIVILIDEFSASASEIIAGALQDNDAALIVGRRSFGKGLVQQGIPLSNGGEIRLTVARYYSPSGRCIQRPYILGETDPEEDLIEKINSGELFSIDNVHLDSTQQFSTMSGRTVFGGGGIMPDFYVPYQRNPVKEQRMAELVRKIMDNESYYRTLLKEDNDFSKALEVINENY
jgi:carboxyl-terminal processing protease